MRAQRGNLLLMVPRGNRPVGQNGWIASADCVSLAMTPPTETFEAMKFGINASVVVALFRPRCRQLTIEYPQHQRGDVVHGEAGRWPRGETCLPASVSIEQKDPVPIMV